MYEVISARTLVFLAADLAKGFENPLYPSTDTLFQLIWHDDAILKPEGNNAFDTLKKMEGLIIETLINKQIQIQLLLHLNTATGVQRVKDVACKFKVIDIDLAWKIRFIAQEQI